jgi:thiamine biosynthesis lipoprotein
MAGGVVHQLAGRTMGTGWTLKYVAPKSSDGTPIGNGVERRLREVVEQMSTWEPSSTLSRFNTAPPGSWHRLDDEFFTVLSVALGVADQGDGAFDPTVGALVNAWGFGPTNRYDSPDFSLPSKAELAEARARSGWRRIKLDRTARLARQPGGLCLDLSSIAKGFAVDHVARYLTQVGIEAFLIEIGGELYGRGVKPDGQPWWVALEQPPHDERDTCGAGQGGRLGETIVALHDLAVATSGDYRRVHVSNGKRLSHTIDPRSGRPIEHSLASVTVLHESCMLADAWSTAFGVMGVTDGLKTAQALGLPVLFVTRVEEGFQEHLSGPMHALLI